VLLFADYGSLITDHSSQEKTLSKKRTDTEDTVELRGAEGKTSVKGKVREYAEAFALAIILALFIRTFVIQAFKIPSPSMVPTLLIGDHILVNKFLYGTKLPFVEDKVISIRDPERGDVVVFRFPKNRKMDFIKRCIATGGETIEIREKKIYIDGKRIDDPHGYFTDNGRNLNVRDNFGPFTVPEGKIFVMGDNRDNSNDSRFWGVVDLSEVKGKAVVIYWSWDGKRVWPRFGRIGDGIH
jgi:signal peptidase I